MLRDLARSSAMAEKPRKLGDFMGVGHCMAKFRLKGYVSRQYLWTFRRRNGYTTTLPLEVFTQSNFVADFIRLKLNFIFKNKKTLFEPPFGGT